MPPQGSWKNQATLCCKELYPSMEAWSIGFHAEFIATGTMTSLLPTLSTNTVPYFPFKPVCAMIFSSIAILDLMNAANSSGWSPTMM